MADTRPAELATPPHPHPPAVTHYPPQTIQDGGTPGPGADRQTAHGQGTLRDGDDAAASDREEAPPRWPSIPGYEIVAELGRGSMGIVYKARQAGLDRLVALKMIRAGSDAGPEELQRFVTEARVVAALQHPNIVQLYDISLDRDSPYFSMELIEGSTLADRLGGLPQPHRPAAELVLTLARAMQIAHAKGIIHRDLKPANILLIAADGSDSVVQRMGRELGLHAPDLCLGIPKITDFGLAKRLNGDAGQTESGMILGTASYMAPEQAEGRAREVGPAADVYALGAILYELLTGRPPFTGQSQMETVLLLFQTEPVPPSRLQPKTPSDLETICLKCLQKEPRKRYASAELLADDLQRFLAGAPILARPASWHEKAWKWTRRRPALATLAACSALAVAVLLGLVLWHHVDLRHQLAQALDEEREARTAQEAVSERERVGQVRARVQELVHAGEGALATRDWANAQLQLTRARDQAADEPELADLKERTEQLLRQTRRQRFDHERLEQFRRRRNEALFQATLFTLDDLAATPRETRAAAREALALFEVTPDSRTGPAVDSPYYDDGQKAEIAQGCYELLVVLAEAVAQPLPRPKGEDKRRQAEEAIRTLDRAARLGVTTQAYHRRRASYLAQAGQTVAADRERRQAEAVHPSTALDHFLLGQEQYRQGNAPQAVAAFENVLQLQADHFWASYYLALCWLKEQRPDRAVACLNGCLVQRRDFPWLYLLRASAWGELGQFDRAEADFDVALHAPLSDTARYGLLMNRGVLRIRQGRLDRAIHDLQAAITLRQQQYQGYVNLAQAHLKGQHLEEARRQLDEAVRREPKLASLYRTRARVHLLRHDLAAALADLDRAVALEAGAAPARLAEDQLERGRILHRQREYRRALDAYDTALRLRPRDAAAHRLRAEALIELERWPEALEALDECLKRGPTDVQALHARAVLRTRLGQYGGAQADYTRALEIDPQAATYAARGWCYLVADAPKLALADFDEAIHLAPEQGDAYAGRGMSRALRGEYRPAVADAEEALRRGPRSARHYYNVARVYAQVVAGVDGEPARDRGTTPAQRGDWQDRAIHLLGKALDLQSPAGAARFWREVVHTDRALRSLRASPEYRRLASRFSSPRAVSGYAVHPTPDRAEVRSPGKETR